MGQYRINTAAPNLLCICIDACVDEDYDGRIYHKYSKDSIPFKKSGSMITIMDHFFDQLNYPQASTRYRSFKKRGELAEQAEEKPCEMEPVLTADEILVQRGKCATFIVHVQYRQNSTWQGNVIWAEENLQENFCSVLELLKLLDNALYQNMSNG